MALWLAASIAALLIAPVPVVASDAVESAAAIARIVETFARPAVDKGGAVGIAVGVTYRGRPPQFFSHGTANIATGTAVTPDTIFQMGSVTKVFTTALLGDAVLSGRLELTLPLSRLEALLGAMPPSTQEITLLNLGDFTSGLPTAPEECPLTPPLLPGCLPNFFPAIDQYGAQDLLDYLRAFSAPRMPAPWLYSDISTGLIGLILGSNLTAPMSDGAVRGWLDLLRRRIVDPLRMTDTFLFDHDASPGQRARLAAGYSPPMVSATASGGGLVISGFTGGCNYSSPPPATVIGGGGSGAAVATAIDDTAGCISSIEVTQPGQGYVAPAQVVFGGNPTTPAQATAVISNGRVIAIRILDGGQGYSPKHLPSVTLTGGTSSPGARAAILAPVTVSNGAVDFVRVLDGGDGYVDPIAVIVAPGAPNDNPVPVWAPAGSLKSSTRDMIAFMQAALGQPAVNGVRIDSRLRRAFRIAQRAYTCQVPGQRPCVLMAGLAWLRNPADGGMPAMVSKNGLTYGFTTELRLVPSLALGVVVFVNTDQTLGTEANGNPQSGAQLVADNIVSAIARSKLP